MDRGTGAGVGIVQQRWAEKVHIDHVYRIGAIRG